MPMPPCPERGIEMKLKEGFVLREVLGEKVVLPSGENLDLNMMITLNETAELIWQRLTVGAEMDELVQALLAEYDVDEARARASVEHFVARLKENDFLAD